MNFKPINVLLIFVITFSQISSAGEDSIILEFEPTTLGGAIVGISGAPYRILFQSWESYPVLYPQPFLADITINSNLIPENIVLSVIVELNFMVTMIRDEQSFAVQHLQFILLNESLSNGKNSFTLDQIEHFSGVSIVLDNGTIIPKTSYIYFEELDPKAIINSTLAVYFEQNDHTQKWNVQFSMDGQLQYSGDKEFYLQVGTSKGLPTNTSQTQFNFVPLIFIFIPLIYKYRRRSISSF